MTEEHEEYLFLDIGAAPLRDHHLADMAGKFDRLGASGWHLRCMVQPHLAVFARKIGALPPANPAVRYPTQKARRRALLQENS